VGIVLVRSPMTMERHLADVEAGVYQPEKEVLQVSSGKDRAAGMEGPTTAELARALADNPRRDLLPAKLRQR
jgi:hypothetical protein